MKNLKNKILLAISAIALTGCSVVGPGERGVRVTFGSAGSEALNSGVYLWIPFVTGVTSLNTRIQKSEVITNAASKDMQDVNTTFALNWRLDPEKIADIYKKIGDEEVVLANVISPAISEVLKAATAKKTAEEILTKRHELKDEIDTEIKARMAKYSIAIDEVNITNVAFSRDFAHAVEKKQIAEQKAKQAEYEALEKQVEAKGAVFKAKGEAEANLVLAKSQAESQKLLQSSVSPAILQLKAIEKWDGTVPQVMGSSGQMLFNIPTKGTKAE